MKCTHPWLFLVSGLVRTPINSTAGSTPPDAHVPSSRLNAQHTRRVGWPYSSTLTNTYKFQPRDMIRRGGFYMCTGKGKRSLIPCKETHDYRSWGQSEDLIHIIVGPDIPASDHAMDVSCVRYEEKGELLMLPGAQNEEDTCSFSCPF